MRILLTTLVLSGAALLSGCTRDCDECDEAAVQWRRADHSAICNCNESVPAPPPIATTPPKVQSTPPVQPKVPEVAARPVLHQGPRPQPQPIVEARRVEAQAAPRMRRVRTGEIEIDDL